MAILHPNLRVIEAESLPYGGVVEGRSNFKEFTKRVNATNVRLQWDPDHNPYGGKEERRAVQLGLRNEFLDPFRGEGIVEITDLSDFVREQREHVRNKSLNKLMTPAEEVYEHSMEY